MEGGERRERVRNQQLRAGVIQAQGEGRAMWSELRRHSTGGLNLNPPSNRDAKASISDEGAGRPLVFPVQEFDVLPLLLITKVPIPTVFSP